MNQFSHFQEALKLNKIDDNSFSINPDSKYFVGRTPH